MLISHDKVYYSNNDVKIFLSSIIRQMTLQSYKPDYIVGIARGGLVPAVQLSHYFLAPMVCLEYSLRDDQVTKSENTLHCISRLLSDNKKILIVDDICDNGTTLAEIDLCLSQCMQNLGLTAITFSLQSAVLIHNEGEKQYEPDFIGHIINKVEKPEWSVFPWEEWYNS